MKAVLQRVKFAKVAVNQAPHPQQIVGEIAHGVLVYLGLGHDDTLSIGQKND
mgnify:FL=1